MQEFKDSFACDYDKIPKLSIDLVEHRLPIQERRKLIKQVPRRFVPNLMEVIKAEIERLLNVKFIQTTGMLNGSLM